MASVMTRVTASLRIIDVYHLDGSSTRPGPEDELTGGEILLVSANIADLFAVP